MFHVKHFIYKGPFKTSSRHPGKEINILMRNYEGNISFQTKKEA